MGGKGEKGVVIRIGGTGTTGGGGIEVMKSDCIPILNYILNFSLI